MARPIQHDRTAVLEKATQLFWEKGYRGVAVSDVVERTGLLPGSIYARFGNKEGLYAACVLHYAETAEQWRRQFDEIPSPLARVRAFLHSMIAQAASPAGRKGCFLVTASQECDEREPQIAAAVSTCVERSVAWFTHQIEAAVACGELAPDTHAPTLATGLQTVLAGLQAMARSGVSSNDLPAAVTAAVESLLRKATPSETR